MSYCLSTWHYWNTQTEMPLKQWQTHIEINKANGDSHSVHSWNNAVCNKLVKMDSVSLCIHLDLICWPLILYLVFTWAKRSLWAHKSNMQHNSLADAVVNNSTDENLLYKKRIRGSICCNMYMWNKINVKIFQRSTKATICKAKTNSQLFIVIELH